MEIIKMDHGDISKLAADFKVSTRTVNKALSGKTKSGLARTLRAAALKRSGQILRSVTNHETEFETAANKMIFTFGDRVKIIGDMTSGDIGVYVDGERRSTYHNLTMKEIVNIQAEAQRIADELELGGPKE